MLDFGSQGWWGSDRGSNELMAVSFLVNYLWEGRKVEILSK